jgi:hypothetical protein
MWLILLNVDYQTVRSNTWGLGNLYVTSALWAKPHGLGTPVSMGKPEEYRRYAQECLELASSLGVPRARVALLHVAHV